MQQQDLVLLGGGHTHVLLIKALAMQPIRGVRVTLVSEQSLTPYSGMLPGFVAGHYSLEQTNIDLNRLCRRTGVRWIRATATAIEPELKRVSLLNQAHIDFDILSIDIGSTPDKSIEGAAEYALGVKPIAGFQQRWQSLLSSLRAARDAEPSTEVRHWGVVGAGAGGVELVLAMAHRMRQHPDLRFHLVYRGSQILPGYPARVVSTANRYLKHAGVELHADANVTAVTERGLQFDSGQTLALDQTILCTPAAGARWLADSSLASTEKNFIEVNRYLQSTSHDCIFAVGDIAEMIEDPRPKAGVYAVRQAPFLAHNLRLKFANKSLRPARLQRDFLSLLSMGDRQAIASRNGLTVSGAWVWRWKDHIDQKFMRQFSDMRMTGNMTLKKHADEQETATMHCGGCGSKLGPELLMENLRLVRKSGGGNDDPRALAVEDASLWKPTPGKLAVQSIDGFRSFTDDEYLFARICVNHAASDIHAMGAGVQSAQAWINLPFSHPRIHQRDHLRILQGIVDGLDDLKADLSGGHSTEGAEAHLAIVANGEVTAEQQWFKSGLQAGDVLLTNKGLGTGVILAADMQGEADAGSVDAACHSMLLSNRAAMQQLRCHNPHAVTDVTGFGLLGHLLEMLDGAAVESAAPLIAELDLAAVPTISGAIALATAGWRSSLYPQLEPLLQRCSVSADDPQRRKLELLIDPQTSGGLLAALSEADAKMLLDDDSDFVVIGRIRLRPEMPVDCADIKIS